MDDAEPLDRTVFDREVYRPALGWRIGAGAMVAVGVVSVVTLGARAMMDPGPILALVVMGVFVVLCTADALSGTVTLTTDRIRVQTLFRLHRVDWEHCRGVRVTGAARAKWVDSLLGGLCGGLAGLLRTLVDKLDFLETLGFVVIVFTCLSLSLRWAVRSLVPASRTAMRPLSGVTIVNTRGRSFRLFGQLAPGDAVRLRVRLKRLGVEQLDGPPD